MCCLFLRLYNLAVLFLVNFNNPDLLFTDLESHSSWCQTGPVVHQFMSLCELLDNDIPGQLITKIAFEGSTTEEMRFSDDILTYQGIEKVTTLHLEIYKWRHTIVHPRCISTLRKYLKRGQLKEKGEVTIHCISLSIYIFNGLMSYVMSFFFCLFTLQ